MATRRARIKVAPNLSAARGASARAATRSETAAKAATATKQQPPLVKKTPVGRIRNTAIVSGDSSNTSNTSHDNGVEPEVNGEVSEAVGPIYSVNNNRETKVGTVSRAGRMVEEMEDEEEGMGKPGSGELPESLEPDSTTTDKRPSDVASAAISAGAADPGANSGGGGGGNNPLPSPPPPQPAKRGKANAAGRPRDLPLRVGREIQQLPPPTTRNASSVAEGTSHTSSVAGWTSIISPVAEGTSNISSVAEGTSNNSPVAGGIGPTSIAAGGTSPTLPAAGETSPNSPSGGVQQVAGPPPSQGIRRSFALKQKFKPNLRMDRRSRNISGESSNRVRKLSTGETRPRHSSESDSNVNAYSAAGAGPLSPRKAAHPNTDGRRRLRSTSASSDDDGGTSAAPAAELGGGVSAGLRPPPSAIRSTVGSDDNFLATPLLDNSSSSNQTSGGGGGGASEVLSSEMAGRGIVPLASPQRSEHGSPAGGASRPRTRRLTESRGLGLESRSAQLVRRKAEHRRRFYAGVPERSQMTMFDLIYYNPENGTRMSVEDDESVCAVTAARKNENRVDDLEEAATAAEENSNMTPQHLPPADITGVKELEDSLVAEGAINDMDVDNEDSMPVPQVKVGANGEIILDEESTVVETSAVKRAKADLGRSPVVVESANSRGTNYGTWSKKRRHTDWSEKETMKFYRALSVVGSDFSMMETLFKKRTRQELKLKFKKEERVNGELIDKCLSQGGQFVDLQDFNEDSEEEEEEDKKPAARGRKRKTKTRTRRKYPYVNKGYYDSSSGGEEGDVSDTSRSPARKRQTVTQTNHHAERTSRRNSVGHDRTPDITTTTTTTTPVRRPKQIYPVVASSSSCQPAVTSTSTSSATATPENIVPAGPAALQKLPGGVQFPPALLAANPSLAGAKPGSLVVVASPSKTDPTAQLLHVYMVSAKKSQQQHRGAATGAGVSPRHRTLSSSSRTPSPSPTRGDPSRLRIDPAVVRAVDRNRQSIERAHNQQRQMMHLRQEQQGGNDPAKGAAVGPSRARTYSEGSLTSRRQRTVSEGSALISRVQSVTHDNTSCDVFMEADAAPDTAAASTITTTIITTTSTTAINTNTNHTLNLLPIAVKSKPAP